MTVKRKYQVGLSSRLKGQQRWKRGKGKQNQQQIGVGGAYRTDYRMQNLLVFLFNLVKLSG